MIMARLDRTTIFKICGGSIMVFSFVLAIVSKPFILVDDAWITFRYAYNLAYHGQLTFNLNERVEGISNMLWTLVLAPQIRLSPSSVVMITVFNTVLFTAFSLYRIWKIGILLKINPVIAALPPSILILSLNFYGTVTNGLEASLFTWLLVEAVYWFLKERPQISSLCLGLLFLTRPEAIVLGLVFLGVLFQPSILLEDKRRLKLQFIGLQSKEKRSEIARCVAVFLGIVIAATLLRLWYYHDFIPNSVRAKIVPFDLILYNSGLEYTINFSKDNPHFIFILCMSLVYLLAKTWALFQRGGKRILTPSLPYQVMIFCFISILFSFAVALRNGGDWMPYFRLLSQYGVLYFIMLLVILSEKVMVVYKGVLMALFALLIFSFVQTSTLFMDRLKSGAPFTNIHYTPGFSFWDETAERLSQAPLVPADVVSSEGIGYISYVLMDTYIHDPLGLTEKHIAREGVNGSPFGKKDIKYTVLRVKPSVMIWQYVRHLRSVDRATLDDEYLTYCHDFCNNWLDADIVMIRKDRAKDLSPYFADWELLTISELMERK
jgi:arabinofuranosyltransferase